MSKALQCLLMIGVVLLTGAAPCLTPTNSPAACPMSHCDRPAADALAVPSCCCAPAGAPASPRGTSATLELFVPASHAATVALAVAVIAPRYAGTTLAPSPDSVPLYLLHATFLI